jgi:hypothetical protein
MTPHQIVVVGLRLLAVVWLLYMVGQVPLLLAQSIASPDGFSVPLMGAFAVVNLAVCAILWSFPATIATKLLPSPKNDVVYENAPASHDWLTLGSILIGVWVLSSAIADTIYWLAFSAMNRFDPVSALNADAKAAMVSTAFELAIGAWLVFGAKGLGALLWKIRTGGVSK